MDVLTHLYANTAGLLARTDDALARWGAPQTHEVWPLLRRTGALPGDAVAALAGWSPQPWRDRAEELRRQADAAEALGERAGGLPGWEGAAGTAFRAAARQLDRDVTAWAGGLRADAAHLDDLARCLAAGRSRTARTLALVAGSAEAVTLVTAPAAGVPVGLPLASVLPGMAVPGAVLAGTAVGGLGPDGAGPVAWARAAAEIGAALLRAIDTTLTELDDLLAAGPAPADRPSAQAAPAAHVPPTDTTLRINL
ncbi:hypothetical protein [Catellatospora sp. NPDC049609]|uniref:hypothetical protein n=1 Tax=Catellatospora sp. NPDC049609 TaxID=3155505 RepID=UPI00343B0466